MKFPSNTIREIKSRLALSPFISKYLPVKNNKSSCPFHVDNTPSFSILTKNQTWRCFGCGLHGDIFTFVRLIERLSFSDTVTLLAQEAGVALPKSERFQGYLSRRWEVKKELLARFEIFRFYLKKAQLDREDQLRLERKKLPPRTQWDSWDAKDFLKEQMIDYKFDCLRDRMKKFEAGFYEKEKEVRGNA